MQPWKLAMSIWTWRNKIDGLFPFHLEWFSLSLGLPFCVAGSVPLGQSLNLLCCVSLALGGDCNSLILAVTCFLMLGHDTLFRYPWVMKSGQVMVVWKKKRYRLSGIKVTIHVFWR
jgi:hypothetical protein